jgi:uncharacterized RDD family membrane protein YckC
MNQTDRYIEEVMRHLLATKQERARFEADLRAHFAEALERGEIHLQIVEKLGTAEAVAEAFNAERPLEHAGFWRRLAAFLADTALLLALAVPLVWLAVTTEAGVVPAFVGVAGMILVGLSLVGFGLIYFPLLESRFGRTLGKHLMRIRVVDESGRPIRLGQAIIRRLSYYFDLLVLDAIFIPFTERKQRGLDILAKTIVVKEPGEDAPGWAWVVGLVGWALLVAMIIAIVVPFAD